MSRTETPAPAAAAPAQGENLHTSSDGARVAAGDTCGPGGQGVSCAVNMGLIHLQAGDLVSAYRFFVPLADKGDQEAITHLVGICERGGDTARAATWRARLDD